MVVDEAWKPVNETEEAMVQALLREDTRAYFQALVDATLYLPAFSGPGPQQLVTCQAGDDTYLLVFTSAQALASRLAGVDAFNVTSYPELVAKWPDPALLLAVDPDLPIQGYMPIHVVAEGAAGRVDLPGIEAPAPAAFPAANDTERALAAAAAQADVDGVIDALVRAGVYLPTAGPVTDLTAADFAWHFVDAEPPAIAVFTSVDRVREGPATPPTVPVAFVDVALAWPDPAYDLVVNPGSELELTIPGAHVLGFVSFAEDLVRAEAGTPAVLRALVRPDEVEGYLRHGWRYVSGRAWPEDEAPNPPVDAGPVHVLRWPGYLPELYEPTGGPRTELRCHAVELPHGARLYRRDPDGRETALAHYDADLEHWVPSR